MVDNSCCNRAMHASARSEAEHLLYIMGALSEDEEDSGTTCNHDARMNNGG